MLFTISAATFFSLRPSMMLSLLNIGRLARVMLPATLISGMKPWALRSCGRRPMPRRMASRGLLNVTFFASTLIEPAVFRRAPASKPASSDWPEPMRPEMPSTSPSYSSRLTPETRSSSQRSVAESRILSLRPAPSRGLRSPRSAASAMEPSRLLPTIAVTTSAGFESAVVKLAALRPSRRIVTESQSEYSSSIR